jgi:hypothetical protein
MEEQLRGFALRCTSTASPPIHFSFRNISIDSILILKSPTSPILPQLETLLHSTMFSKTASAHLPLASSCTNTSKVHQNRRYLPGSESSLGFSGIHRRCPSTIPNLALQSNPVSGFHRDSRSSQPSLLRFPRRTVASVHIGAGSVPDGWQWYAYSSAGCVDSVGIIG